MARPDAALFEARSFGRFLVVGGLNTVVAFGGFPLLYLMIGHRVGYLPILVFCALFNPVFSFVMHRYVTFASQGPASTQIGRYLPLSLAAFLASWGFWPRSTAGAGAGSCWRRLGSASS